MARRKDIAGLAALGALGLMLKGRGDSSTSSADSDSASLGSASDYGDFAEISDRKENYGNEGMRTGNRGTVPIGKPRAPASKRLTGDDQYNPDVTQGRVAGQGGPRGPRYSETDTGDETSRLRNRVPVSKAPVSNRRLNSAESLAQLDSQTGVRPMDPNSDRGPNAITSTEFGRNVSNTLGALTPIGGGVGKVAAELPYMGRAQKAYNERAAMRRAEEGLSAEEAARATVSARDAKTLNPMAWMAGPKGMKDNFKRGGQVKKMASGGKVSASSRGDGIAMRGKTRGMMR